MSSFCSQVQRIWLTDRANDPSKLVVNYQANLDWMDHLRSLKIPFERRIVEGVPHNTQMIHENAGLEIMKFHADNFETAAK